MNRKPNILFFFTDDQRFDTIRALGNGQIQTPHLDELVASGTAFTHAHIPGGTCGAVCMPSRAMLHTGRTLFHIEREGQQIPETHTTLCECFRNAGYITFGTGKWHNGRSSYARSFSCGDEIFFGGMGDHWNVPAYRFDPTGKYDRRCPYVADPFLSNTIEFRDCDHIETGRHSTDLFVEASLRFIENRDASRPFFMYVSLMAPHDPRTMPERFLKMYDHASIDLPPNFLPEHPIDTGALKIRDELLAAFPRDPQEVRRHIAEYYAMISHLDEAFGRLIAALREHGELDNTIAVMAGDNGLAVGQHGLMGKQNLYDHSVRVPLVFAGPGIPRGQHRESLVYLLDIFPTLCDLTDTEIPSTVEGKSLRPCLANPDAEVRPSLFLAYADSIRGVTDGRHKLIEYACGATQLFDLSRDASEINNLANDDASGTTVAQMRQRLLGLVNEWDEEDHPTGKEFWAKRRDLKQ
ncbi:MAG: sulfatase-like hydrolase/transferase [Kiritimatiellae bacterium]|nr:sulfatase-like hydrolase/transferase [Verrucomicrobiota bacterium]MCG2659334.1 sulfatase-like hydrolase/transferase [Kiritimatiellia bacterium]